MVTDSQKRAGFGWLALVLMLFSLLLNRSVFAADVELLYFYEAGCSGCVKLEEFLEQRIEPNYPIVIRRYDVHTPDNANLMLDMADAYGAEEILKKGPPAIFVGDKTFQGSSRTMLEAVEQAVRMVVSAEEPNAINLTAKKAGSEKNKIKRQLTLPAVIGASAVDAVNPCAFGVLALLLGTMLVISKTKKRRHVITAGFAFTAATFICYFLMGIGLFFTIQTAGVQRYIYFAVSILAILIGLWNTKDYFWYNKGMNIEVPKSWRPGLKRITSGVTSAPSAFVVGCLVSVFLLPCTSGPYVVIIGMLGDSATRVQAVRLLIIYNFIFVLPFIIITLAVAFGLTSPARVETWRQKWLEKLHLLTGIFMLVLGITMVTLLALGVI